MMIQKYLDSLLNEGLEEVRFRFRQRIAEDIKNRLCSLLARWEEEEYRETILFTTKEEALFYEPYAEKGIRELVVAGIRNSMLEVAASVNCKDFKMPEPLSDKKIRELTAEAIRYFSDCELRALIQEAQNTVYEDVYEAAKCKYPLAWTVLSKIALLEASEWGFDKIQEEKKRVLTEEEMRTEPKIQKVICDGFTLEFDEYLEETIREVVGGKQDAFYVDSFKALSRNIEKVLHVIQILLESDRAFVTCNYYISNGYLEKRKKILRAAHNEKEMFMNTRITGRTPKKIKEFLQIFV